VLSGLLAPTAADRGGPTAAVAPAVSSVAAEVTWNGANVASFGTPSAAVATSFASTIDVRYSWSATPGPLGLPGLFNVSDARLQMFYFGVALGTRDVLEANPHAAASGVIDMKWDASVLQYLVEGTYELTASLLAPNGTTLWSESFYLHASAPYFVLALVPLLMILLAIYEAYGLLTSGSQARRKALPAKAPPSGGAPPPSANESGSGAGFGGRTSDGSVEPGGAGGSSGGGPG
ncbi:MAG: hypothetical protein ACREC5_06000, partial [Thermoplasmata archaeon]